MKVQRSIDIKATPEKIWPFLVEPEKILKWFTHLQKFEYTGEKRNSIGTTFYYEEKSSGKLMKMNYKVTEWVKNKKIAFSVTSGSLKKDDQVWSIEATADRKPIYHVRRPGLGDGNFRKHYRRVRQDDDRQKPAGYNS